MSGGTLYLLLAGAIGCMAADVPGYKILWATFRTGDTEIFVADTDSGDLTNLTRSPGSSERYPAWSPDGRKVSFNSDRDGTFNLYVMDADGRNVRQLTREKAPVVTGMQSWTADGRWIYFGVFGKKEPQMCRIHPDGSGFEVIGTGIDAAVSPDGKTIVYAKALAKGHCLFAADAGGRNERQLTFEENPFAGVHAAWTPDGRRIIYADRVGETLELFSIEPDGKNRKQLTSLGQAATSPAVSPDNKWITFRLCDEIYWRSAETSKRAYGERRPDKRPVWVMGIGGENPRVLELLRFHTTIDGSRAPMAMKRRD